MGYVVQVSGAKEIALKYWKVKYYSRYPMFYSCKGKLFALV